MVPMPEILKRHFLPLGLLSAMVLGMAVPKPGTDFAAWQALGLGSHQWLIVIVFFIAGLLFKPGELPPGKKLGAGFGLAASINLLGGPLLGWLLAAAFQALGQPLQAGLATGAWLMLIVPTTLSSAAVITRQAGGNASLAVVLTLGLAVAGIATTAWFDSTAAGLDPLQRLASLSKIVLLPLAAGLALARAWQPGRRDLWALLPSLCIILMVWKSVSQYASPLAGLDPGWLLACIPLALALHFILWGAAWSGSPWLGLGRADQIAVSFIASQKTLPLALLLLNGRNLAGPDMARAIAFLLIFHFSQIAADSLLASSFHSRLKKVQ